MPERRRTARFNFGGFQRWLKERRDPLDKDSKGMTALHRAAQKGDSELVERLKNDPLVTAADRYGRVALLYAAENGYDDIVQILVEPTGVDTVDKFKRTALHWAAENNHAQVVRLLLERGAEVQLYDGYGQRALSRAAFRGWDEIVMLLLEAGATPFSLPDHNENTALHLAVENSHEAVATRLFRTILLDDMGKAEGSLTAEERHMFQHNSIRDWYDEITCWAAKNKDMKLTKLLREKEVDGSWFQGLNQWAALRIMSEKGDVNAVDHLLKAEVDPNVADDAGWTVLHYAAEKGHSEVVDHLLKAGSNLKTASKAGVTALHRAAENGHGKVVNQLLKCQKEWRRVLA
ncbi:ankyrin repeat-containing domain protein [Xylaria sp. FL0933]|nr:ankyrin repeat-containing domain protein [Xylaria sp. FL0933]